MNDSTPTSKRGLSRTSLICGGLLWTIVFASLGFVWLNRDLKSEAAGSALPGSGIQGETGELTNSASSVKLNFPARELPDFEFDECMGGTVSLEDLKGKPWVASFIFTSCPTTCPMITTSMMKLQNQVIDKNPDVMLVTITVNPKYDKVDVMKTYSETFRPDRDRWKFLTGNQQEIYELVVNGFGLYVKENVGEMRTPGFEVAHSNRVVLVNEEGTPVGTFLGTKDDDMVKLRRILTGKDDFPEAGPALSISSTGGATRAIKFDVKPVEDADANVGSEGQNKSAEQPDEAGSSPVKTDSAVLDDAAASGEKKN